MRWGADRRGPGTEDLDVDDLSGCISNVEQAPDVSPVARHDVRPKLGCRCGHYGVDYIARACPAKQSPSGVRPLLGQAHDLTTAQQPSELDLRRRAAHLSDNGRGDHGDDTRLQPYPVLRPDGARIAIRGHQDGSVVNHRCHADRCSGPLTPARRRAASSSSRVKTPCSASHSATAMRPSRSLSARLAAAVIQADTLTPSASAAATTRAWTSGSTVIASFGEGLPRGMKQTIPP